MKYERASVEALRGYSVLREYCRAVLGPCERAGGVEKHPCPFGVHSRAKLEIADKGGQGVALCRACNRGGSVFDIAAAVLGCDVREDFLRCVEEVAEKTGAALVRGENLKARGRQRKRNAAVEAACSSGCVKRRETPPACLPPEEEAAAFEAVRRAAASPSLDGFAVELGLPVDVLRAHADLEHVGLGLLGLSAAGRLVYVYTGRDESGNWRVLMTKERGRPGEEPRFRAHGKKSSLWGACSVGDAARVIITEGESDALALRASVWSWMDLWAHADPATFPDFSTFPVVLAKPDAGTFRAQWANDFCGRDCIIAADNDEAGRLGAQRTAGILRSVGVRRIFLWSPPGAYKDARAAFDLSRPWSLIESVFTEKKAWTCPGSGEIAI